MPVTTPLALTVATAALLVDQVTVVGAPPDTCTSAVSVAWSPGFNMTLLGFTVTPSTVGPGGGVRTTGTMSESRTPPPLSPTTWMTACAFPGIRVPNPADALLARIPFPGRTHVPGGSTPMGAPHTTSDPLAARRADGWSSHAWTATSESGAFVWLVMVAAKPSPCPSSCRLDCAASVTASSVTGLNNQTATRNWDPGFPTSRTTSVFRFASTNTSLT